MEKEFTPYEIALALKELGFDKPCLGYFYNSELSFGARTSYGEVVEAPTFSQAFRFFREKYNLHGWSFPCCDEDNSYSFTIYKNHSPYFNDETLSFLNFNSNEEAELECLKKLIEIVKTTKQ